MRCTPQGLSIVELGVLIIFNQFELLAEKHFVDHSGKLSTEQAREMQPEMQREMRLRCARDADRDAPLTRALDRPDRRDAPPARADKGALVRRVPHVAQVPTTAVVLVYARYG